MTAKIFSKDLRLAAHPMMYVFALFGVMLIIPNYPYTVVFFYGLLGIFFTFLNGLRIRTSITAPCCRSRSATRCAPAPGSSWRWSWRSS